MSTVSSQFDTVTAEALVRILRKPDLEDASSRFAELARKHKLSLIILFGSQISKRLHRESDIDIAVMPNIPKSFDSMDFWCDLAETFRTDKIDIVNLKTCEPLMAWNVARGGRALYAASDEYWNRFQIRAMKAFDDVKRFDNLRARSIERFLREWGTRP